MQGWFLLRAKPQTQEYDVATCRAVMRCRVAKICDMRRGKIENRRRIVCKFFGPKSKFYKQFINLQNFFTGRRICREFYDVFWPTNKAVVTDGRERVAHRVYEDRSRPPSDLWLHLFPCRLDTTNHLKLCKVTLRVLNTWKRLHWLCVWFEWER